MTTDQKEYLMYVVYTKSGMTEQLKARWQRLNYNPPKGGWQLQLL